MTGLSIKKFSARDLTFSFKQAVHVWQFLPVSKKLKVRLWLSFFLRYKSTLLQEVCDREALCRCSNRRFWLFFFLNNLIEGSEHRHRLVTREVDLWLFFFVYVSLTQLLAITAEFQLNHFVYLANILIKHLMKVSISVWLGCAEDAMYISLLWYSRFDFLRRLAFFSEANFTVDFKWPMHLAFYHGLWILLFMFDLFFRCLVILFSFRRILLRCYFLFLLMHSRNAFLYVVQRWFHLFMNAVELVQLHLEVMVSLLVQHRPLIELLFVI